MGLCMSVIPPTIVYRSLPDLFVYIYIYICVCVCVCVCVYVCVFLSDLCLHIIM